MDTIKAKIRTIPDFPKKGILFRDITTLLKDAQGLRQTVDAFVNRYQTMDIDMVAGIESRGFIIAGAIACRLGRGFIPIRKPGKLPAETYRRDYQLEYGTDAIEMHKDAVMPGMRVLMVDDLQFLIGKDNSQIAASLGISVGTVKSHVVSILDKMGVDSRLAIACLVHDLQARLN